MCNVWTGAGQVQEDQELEKRCSFAHIAEISISGYGPLVAHNALYCTMMQYCTVLGRVRSRDGVYRDWSVARWARRMHMDR